MVHLLRQWSTEVNNSLLKCHLHTHECWFKVAIKTKMSHLQREERRESSHRRNESKKDKSSSIVQMLSVEMQTMSHAKWGSRSRSAICKFSQQAIRQPGLLALCLSYAELTDLPYLALIMRVNQKKKIPLNWCEETTNWFMFFSCTALGGNQPVLRKQNESTRGIFSKAERGFGVWSNVPSYFLLKPKS